MADFDPNTATAVADTPAFDPTTAAPVAEQTPPPQGEQQTFAPGSPREIAHEQAVPYLPSVITSDQPLLKGEQLPYTEGESGIVRGLKATQNVVNRFGETLARPSSIAGILFPPLGIAQAATGIAQQPGEIYKAFSENPPGSPQRAEAVAGGALTLAMLAFGAKGLHEGITTPATESVVAKELPTAREPVPENLQPKIGEPNAIEPSNAQVQTGETPQRVEAGAASGESPASNRNNVIGEAQGAAARGEIPGTEARQGTEAQPQAEVTPPEKPPTPPPEQGALGIGAPSPEGDKLTGLTKEYLSEDRAARGEEPLAAQARKTNAQAWDNADQVFQRNPNAGHELVKSLLDNPRAVDENDLGILLRHRVNLSNQTDFEFNRAFGEKTSPIEASDAIVKLNALRDARNEADLATDQVGTQAGKSLQFLKNLATQDYSLSSMIKERQAAMAGKPLTPEQTRQVGDYSKELLEADRAWQEYLRKPKAESALAAYKTRLKGATTEYERRQAFYDFEPQIRKQLELDPEAEQLKANFEKAKLDWQKLLNKDQIENRPLWQKLLSGAAWAARESALSGYHTLAKIGMFTVGKLGEIPITETAERGIGQLPGFRNIVANSEFGPGANARQLGEFYKEFATTGFKEAWQQLKTGASRLRTTYGKEKLSLQYPSYFGNLHGAEKSLVLTGSTAMNRMKLMDQALQKYASESIAQGRDPSSPPEQAAINYKSFRAATYDILQEDNWAADQANGILARMEKVQPKTGEVSMAQTGLAALLRIFATKGIVRTPLNYVKQSIERTPAGLAYGSARALRSLARGAENVKPAENSAIMKLMGVGAVGTGMFTWGVLDALKPPSQRVFGGYYQPGEKRDPNDVKFGSIRAFGAQIPHLMTHFPMTESAQIGNTITRVALSAMSKKDRQNKGLVRGVIAGIFGLAEQAPIANPAIRISKVGDPASQNKVLGDLVRGLIPQLVQNIASDTDKSEVGRKPESIVETAKLGIPGLREQVKERQPKQSKRVDEYGLPR